MGDSNSTDWQKLICAISQSNPTLILRESEQQVIRTHLSQQNNGVLLIHGKPGTGKTAITTNLCRTQSDHFIQFNGVQMSTRTIAKNKEALIAALDLSSNLKSNKKKNISLSTIGRIVGQRKARTLLLIDEFEHLHSKKYTKLIEDLFIWANRRWIQLVLISNRSFDSPNDILKHLSCINTPKWSVCAFTAYNRDEIFEIIRSRIPTLMQKHVPDNVLRFLCGKAAITGDLRTSLQMFKNAIEKAREHKLTILNLQSVLAANENSQFTLRNAISKQTLSPHEIVLLLSLNRHNKGRMNHTCNLIDLINISNAIYIEAKFTAPSRNELQDILCRLDDKSLLLFDSTKGEISRCSFSLESLTHRVKEKFPHLIKYLTF